MAKVTISLAPLDARAFSSLVLDELAKKLTAAFEASRGDLGKAVAAIVATAVEASPEYASLLSGKLRNQLGVVDAAPVLTHVIRNIQEGIVVTNLGAKRSGDSLTGGLRIELIKDDYSEVLSAPGANFMSEKGHKVEWLKWLTLAGDRVVIADYRYSAGYSAYSRTGNGLMLLKGSWGVPPEFSGTSEDNFLTRALLAQEKTFGDEVGRVLKEYI